MGDFLRNELYKVWDQLMKTRVTSYARQSGDAIFVIGLVENSAADFAKV